MSITVKNIAFSIAGTPSKQFNIELDGAKYSLDHFKLTQKLLEPCRLEFKLCKAPDEDINEIQFTTCGSMIGKDVILSLQTDSTEQDISGFSAGSQNADIEFEGFVTSAKATRKESEYGIEVVAETKDVVLKDSPNFCLFNEMSLKDIVNDVTSFAGVGIELNPQKEDKIFYTVEYNETNYEFLQRLAQRHGEWMFNTGKKLHFGKFSQQDSIVLSYPSQDLPEYSARLKTFHVKHKFHQCSYNDSFISNDYSGEDQETTNNDLNDRTFAASLDKFGHGTLSEIKSLSLERDEEMDKACLNTDTFNEPSTAYKQGRRANMLVYEGLSYCSKMKIGAKLTIKDNYLSSGGDSQKSEVQQDEILITEVVHEFTNAHEYKNSFKGITASISFPPYLDPTIYPVCNHPLRGVVEATEDPKHWGRVRVTFNTPSVRHEDSSDEKYWTPWIHVSQPYSGQYDPRFGMHFIPEIGSQVYIDFDAGNMERPFVSGGYMPATYCPVDDAWYPGSNNVKAIRTASGHTIEIHDNMNSPSMESGGFIKIYDHQTQNYELLFSTDKKLIRLHSKGNIELFADNDIVLNAGRNIKVSAGKPDKAKSLEDGDSGCFLLNVETDLHGYVGLDSRMDVENLAMVTTNRRRIKTETYISESKESKHDVYSELDIYVHPNGSPSPSTSINATQDTLKIRATNEVDIKGSVNTKVSGANVEVSGDAQVAIKAPIINMN